MENESSRSSEVQRMQECNGLAEGVMMGKWPSSSGALEVIDNGEDRKQRPMTSHTLL